MDESLPIPRIIFVYIYGLHSHRFINILIPIFHPIVKHKPHPHDKSGHVQEMVNSSPHNYPCLPLSTMYGDHKLPSVVTRDLALNHESRLAPATRVSLSVTRDLACLAIRDPQVRSANQAGSPLATRDSRPASRDPRVTTRESRLKSRVTNRYSPLVTRDSGLRSRESRVTSRWSWVADRESRVASRGSRVAGRGSRVAGREWWAGLIGWPNLRITNR